MASVLKGPRNYSKNGTSMAELTWGGWYPSENPTTAIPAFGCPYCSGAGTTVWHGGGPCPNVKAIEYHENGQIKRIEFRDEHG